MASLRKASAYTKKRTLPFTRTSKKRAKSYVKTVPSQKVVKFNMGKVKKEELAHHLTLVSCENAQIRHNSLEACRQYINKKLDKALAGQYFFNIIPYPHHIQRENKMLTGAGADRMQTGMQLAYGKSASKAALLKTGSKIFFIAVPNENAVRLVRKTFGQIKAKLPCKVKVLYENIK